MSSTSAELNALATTSIVDFYHRLFKRKDNLKKDIQMSKFFTLVWGLIAIGFASLATSYDNLVEFVNILGSLFYGTVLGIFLVALYIKFIRGRAVLIAASIAQIFIFSIHFFKDQVAELFQTSISFLWYNLIASVLVVLLSLLFEALIPSGRDV
jgi:Na+/proline symporter